MDFHNNSSKNELTVATGALANTRSEWDTHPLLQTATPTRSFETPSYRLNLSTNPILIPPKSQNAQQQTEQRIIHKAT